MAQESTDLTMQLDGAVALTLRDRREWPEASDWLADLRRPGRFSRDMTSVGVVFRITDPDVAVEFRMRWT